MSKKAVMTALFIRLVFCLTLIGGLIAAGSEARQTADVVKISRFSGKPLPRFESLRYSAVHGRQGPNLDHKILWRYEREGLPMLVVRETHGWRRVRDPDGDEVWMQARMLSETRTALVTGEVELKRAPDPEARSKAHLKQGVIAELIACDNGWCEIEIGRKSGYLPETALWGTEVATGKL
ncbi:MAG: SH3 domain-containing protein [Hyphomonadaceae bacterium]|nr:SH3 domain-containing protein [Hyphomonadaceae bacterium]